MSSYQELDMSGEAPFDSGAEDHPYVSDSEQEEPKTVPEYDPGKQELVSYQDLWPGKNTFLCGGRCMLGHDPKLLPVTFFSILLTAVYFVVSVLPQLKVQLNVGSGTTGIDILFVGLLTVVFASLYSAAFTEPGILVASKFSQTVPKYVPRFDENALNARRTYCPRCNIDRPQRARHCRHCDHCVDQFDHHCTWIGNDVGLRNYRSFLWFVGSLTLLVVWVGGGCALVIVLECKKFQSAVEGDGWKLLLDLLAPGLVCLLCVCAFFLVGFLAIYHFFYLMCYGETTNEHLKGTYRRLNLRNPYNRGWLCNCIYICCVRQPPSMIPRDFREKILMDKDDMV